MMAVIFLTRLVAARHMPGEAPAFYLEMPPLRLPRLCNVLSKTYSRMHWYLREILPLFLAASAVIWLGNMTGVFKWTSPPSNPGRAMGLPAAAAGSCCSGSSAAITARRGCSIFSATAALTTARFSCASLVITLFLPCVAQFFIMKKERGWKFPSPPHFPYCCSPPGMGVVANAILMRTGWLG